MDTKTIIQIILTVIGSSALFSFIQFLIQRSDNHNDKFKELREEYLKGLNVREETGRKRYEEHRESIAKLNDAILLLTKNDDDINKYLHFMGDELMGLAHDKLVFLTNKISKRNAITLKEKATLNFIYIPYSEGLGGNGDGKTGYEYVMGLRVVSDAEAERLDEELGGNK